jgi:hypothetical protein
MTGYLYRPIIGDTGMLVDSDGISPIYVQWDARMDTVYALCGGGADRAEIDSEIYQHLILAISS